MAGARPKPPVLKLIEGRGNGRDSGGRKVADTPKFRRLPPDAPEWLPDEARAEWERIVPELSRVDLLKPVDRAAMVAYCLAWDRLVEANRMLASESLITNTSQGISRHPAVMIAEAASKEIRAWAAEFGLTPSAENKLSVREADDGEDDPFS